MRSIALVCLVDLRNEALNRHIGDLSLFLLASDSIRALWSESDPIWCVFRLKEGRIVGDMKM